MPSASCRGHTVSGQALGPWRKTSCASDDTAKPGRAPQGSEDRAASLAGEHMPVVKAHLPALTFSSENDQGLRLVRVKSSRAVDHVASACGRPSSNCPYFSVAPLCAHHYLTRTCGGEVGGSAGRRRQPWTGSRFESCLRQQCLPSPRVR